jgi:hypothetical protein
VPSHSIIGTAPGAAIELTVDDNRRQADAVTIGRHRDGGIVHVANFDVVLGASQKLDHFHSLGAGEATGCKDIFRR